ncbi:MAG: hypothetical protein QM820_04215 [Minicystis sp.]
MTAAVVISAAGCHQGGELPWYDAGLGGFGTGGTGGTGASTPVDAGMDAPDFCGQCVPGQASGWSPPELVWFGQEKDAPKCPLVAPQADFEGYTDLDAPIDCGTCSCGAPSGSCALPTAMTANAASCALNGSATPHTPFNPEVGWAGACDTNQSIPSGKLCSGVKCVQSLTIGPLALSEGACTPSEPPAQPAPVWKSFARGCHAVPLTWCNGGASVCLGVPPPELGFRVCMYHDGDKDCPAISPYQDKHVLYQDYEDTRACTGCTCDAPAGSTCASTITVFSDGACSAPLYSFTIGSTNPDCHDVPAGTPLGSKSATAPVYKPGSCTPGGGQPMGAATPAHASTYCCLPQP